MPTDVTFKVDPVKTPYFVLQVHYAHKMEEEDSSAISVEFQTEPWDLAIFIIPIWFELIDEIFSLGWPENPQNLHLNEKSNFSNFGRGVFIFITKQMYLIWINLASYLVIQMGKSFSFILPMSIVFHSLILIYNR